MQPFEMPPVCLGQTVVWYADGDTHAKPIAAIVTDVGHGHVSLATFRPLTINCGAPSGVQHVNDPRVKANYNGEGAWDYTEVDKARIADQTPRAPSKKVA